MIRVEVACAVIERKGELLIAQRKPGDSLSGYWEFPGGKRKDSESFAACLVREVREELGVLIQPRQFLRKVAYSYPEKQVSLHFYLCAWVSGAPSKKDCFDFRWVRPEALRSFLFPPADHDLIRDLIQRKRLYFGV